jgi:Spy/CpxP family protein refolding chaperone
MNRRRFMLGLGALLASGVALGCVPEPTATPRPSAHQAGRQPDRNAPLHRGHTQTTGKPHREPARGATAHGRGPGLFRYQAADHSAHQRFPRVY